MIEAIGYQNLKSKKFSFKNNGMQKNVTVPVPTTQSVVHEAYSLNNLKANYMPVNFGKEISFCGTADKSLVKFIAHKADDDETKIPKGLESQNIGVDVTRLSKNRIKGDYYADFSEDLAVLIRTNQHLILETDAGVDPEIFVHNLVNHMEIADRAKDGKGKKSKVIYIKDPNAAVGEHLKKDIAARWSEIIHERDDGREINIEVPERTVWDTIGELYKTESSSKIVFVNGASKAFHDAPIEEGTSIGDYLKSVCPNISTVNLVDKLYDGEGKHISLKSMDVKDEKIVVDVPVLELKGLNVQDAKAFLRENPQFIENIFADYRETHLDISPEALDLLIDKTALVSKEALPTSAYKMLNMVAAAKINDAQSLDKRGHVVISPEDVNGFFLNHSKLVDLYKPELGQFNLAENVTTKLSDVGGCYNAKEVIQEDIIAFLKNPKKFIEERGSAPKGILLKGPPGTGKTLLAMAVAGETHTPFMATSGSEFVEKYVGTGAKRVREFFSKLRKAAENSSNKTAIGFIDEFDALARKRSSGDDSGKEAAQTLNQLLTEMDGFNNKESKIKVIIIAATNRDDILDEAAIRRFDDKITVNNPQTNAERLEILNIHARKLKFESEAEKAKILDEAAKITDDMSGDSIAKVMKKAQKVVSKREINKFVTHDDVVEGLLQTIAGPVQKGSEERPFEEIVKTVRHEGGHATAIDFLKPLFNEKISFITLDSRGDFLGAVFHHQPRVNPNFKSVILSAAVSYAGGLAEPGFNSEGRAAGARQDLSNATTLFRRAITEWGQGVYTPPIGLAPVDCDKASAAAEAFYRTMQSANQGNIEKDINLLSKTSERVAKMINEFHKDFLDGYVERFKANAGKGGNNLSGEAFAKLRQAWLAKTGKAEAERALLNTVAGILDAAYHSNEGILNKTAQIVGDAYHSNKGLVERLLKKAIRTAKQAV